MVVGSHLSLKQESHAVAHPLPPATLGYAFKCDERAFCNRIVSELQHDLASGLSLQYRRDDLGVHFHARVEVLVSPSWHGHVEIIAQPDRKATGRSFPDTRFRDRLMGTV